MIMTSLKILTALVLGLVVLNGIAEITEYVLILFTSGLSGEELRSNSDLYFEIRNRPVILIAKMVYTFVASMVAGYTSSWWAASNRRQVVVALTVVQLSFLIWAGFFSTMGETGPDVMWIALCFAVAIGINTGYKTYVKILLGRRN